MLGILDALIYLFFIAFIIIVLFYIACGITMLFTGCDMDGATREIQNFFCNKSKKELDVDAGFRQEVAETVRTVLGEAKYEYILRVSRTAIEKPLLYFDAKGKLPCINISMYCNEEQKKVLENLLSNVLKKYLHIYKYVNIFIVDWKFREDLNMPYLEFVYARNRDEQHILNRLLIEEREKFRIANSVVVDETEMEELDG